MESEKSEIYRQIIEKVEAQGPFKIYQSWKSGDLDIDGQRPIDMRYKIYGLDKLIGPDTTVLDLGSNIGFMSLKCAQNASEVHGVERYIQWVEIARLAAEFLEIDNCHFHVTDALAFDPPYKFDVMLSLSFHHWGPDVFAKYAATVYRGMLKPGGHLLFESHALTAREPFEQYAIYLQSIGFEIVNEGRCQCPTNYPRPNPPRKWYMLRLKKDE